MNQSRSVFAVSLMTTVFLLITSGCGSSNSASSTEDSSASGTVASALGGGFNGSSGGTVSMLESNTKFARLFDLESLFSNAYAANSVCPTIPGSASGCAVSGSSATLTYSNCSFSGASATWSGSQNVAFSGVSPVCGSAFPTSQSQVVRTFPTLTTRTAASGTSVKIDTQGAYQDYLGSTLSGGYTMAWSSGKPSSLTINGVNLIATSASGGALFNHSLTSGALTITNGNTISSGTVTLYHNIAKVTATSTLSNIVFQSGSCTPYSGTITTVYGAIAGSRYNNATETLTFNNGVATYTGPEGYSGTVTLAHCF